MKLLDFVRVIEGTILGMETYKTIMFYQCILFFLLAISTVIKGQDCPDGICTGCGGQFSQPTFEESSKAPFEFVCDVTLSWNYPFEPEDQINSPGMVFTCSYDDGSLCTGSEVEICASCSSITFSNLDTARNPFIVYSDTCGNIDTIAIAEDCQFGETTTIQTTEAETTTTTPEIITTTTGAPSVQCSGVFKEVGGLCLFIDPFTSASWDEARFFCFEFNADLVSIENDETYLAIIDYIYDNAIDHESYWIGGSDRAVEGSWRWNDGEVMQMGTPYWAVYYSDRNGTASYVQEPADQGTLDYDCVHMDGGRFFYYDDDDCREQKSIICEKLDIESAEFVEI